MWSTNTLLLILYAALNCDFSYALRDVRVQIPFAVRRGDKAILKCFYDIEDDTLYSVKWYKGRREFYRYTPKENPPMKVFHFAGVRVERSISNESQLVLDAVNLASTGKYSCEVSADAPSFHTLIAAGELDVVEVPHNAPFIIGLRPRYRIGDILRGNCTSRHSKPAANLTWTVNNDEINPVHVRYHKVLRDLRIDYETSVSGIHFIVTPHHFLNGKMKVICSAQIYDVYFKSTERIIIDLDYQQKYVSLGSNVLLTDDNYDQLHVVQDGEFLRKKDNNKRNYLTQLQEFFFNVVPTGENTDNSVWFTSSSSAYCYTSINTVPMLLMTTILLCYCNLSCLDEFLACMVQCTAVGNRSKQYQTNAPGQLCATLTLQHRRRKWASVQQAQQRHIKYHVL